MSGVIDPPVSRLYRISVDQYEEMARLGVLTKNDRVELIEGYIVEKMTKNEPHITTTWMIRQALADIVPRGWFVVTESPVVLERSEPEPDVMVVRGKFADYFHRKPTAADLRLVVEVSDSSYPDDLRRRSMYCRGGVPEYWIANIREGRIETYTDPEGSEYRSRRDFNREDRLTLLLDGITSELEVGELLAPG